ncbi:molybdopterin-synthase adenylyltransferase MoeB [Gephyromycinifex aptenodytis]|uniref:molybdopterin-synthase adenylyltransferase MoeB n=1 Tax=Gephyromycinifex aptenodytis TaxID=2716227 RepID=UPI0014483515|nr:molybdopterin-synthase adenylyltransferase MoeB [Gephyromycinifex aptenodytis]
MSVDPRPAPLTSDELRRYSRQLSLAELGEPGQRRLAGARVLIIGAGGLGSPALLYLAAAGVGTIGIVDDDVVEVSNLHRQVIHGEDTLGQAKTTSAARRLREMNPHVQVIEHEQRLRAGSAADIVAGYDLVIDGCDNFPTRYLVNDAAAMAGIPLVWASISRFEGQLSVWWAGHGPCYRCVFPTPPPPGAVPSCAQGGVLGMLPGVIGAMAAAEAVKIITGMGEPLIGRILLHDILAASWDTIRVRPRPTCSVCGPQAGPIVLRDLQEDQPTAATSPSEAEGAQLDSERLAGALAADEVLLLDVREEHERATGVIPGSLGWPLGLLLEGELPPGLDRPVVAYCASGVRSLRAVEALTQAGVSQAQSLRGGINAWTGELAMPDGS